MAATQPPRKELGALLRKLRLGWLVSLLLMMWLCWGLAVNPVRTLGVLMLICLILWSVLGRIVLPKNDIVRAGYWFFAARAATSLHFLPPRELREARRTKGDAQALKELRSLLGDLKAHGVRFLSAETNLRAIERLGFRPVGFATPLSWLFTVLQHRAATGRWYLRWPRVYVYAGDAFRRGRRAASAGQSAVRRELLGFPLERQH